MPTPPRATPFAIRRLRAVVLVALVVGISAFTATIFGSVERLSDRFGPQVRADLEWRAMRGATELARAADLGIAMEDASLIQEAFRGYSSSTDILALIAVNKDGQVITRHGDRDATPVFGAKPYTIVDSEGALASWAPVIIEGAAVGKIAVFVSTTRLSETREILTNVARTTLIAGVIVFVLGALVVLRVTRAIATRDAELSDYAANLQVRVEDRTRELGQRNEGMRLVLDNVAEGFITIDATGAMASERSAIVDRWFGPPAPGSTFADYMRGPSPEVAVWFELGMQMLADNILPPAFCLDQLPKRLLANGQTFEITYSPIMAGDQLERVLVIINDVTAELARTSAESDQRELVTVFQHISGDRTAGDELVTEGAALVEELLTSCDRVTEDRALHTLKGNAGLFGFERFAELCHAVEVELADSDAEGLTERQRQRIVDGWQRVTRTLSSLRGDTSRDVIEVTRPELAAMIERAREGEDVTLALTEWSCEPVARRFERLGQQAASLALRLGKGELDVTISDHGIRLDPQRWTSLWTVLSHAIRNAVDHGLESVDERALTGKGRPHLTFAAARTDEQLVLSIADDGRGVDWDAVRVRAEKVGGACETRHDLVEAMFADGVSTRSDLGRTSGRGVGLAALRAGVVALGGTIDVESAPSRGTRFEMRFPVTQDTFRLPSTSTLERSGARR